ncbi:hypothetical protein C8R47DRAFT_1205579 [Mycena vitilis]|nr:hypothetical protein C8R47DRAFT_1205579 [Mycena vitilis]
MVGPTIAADLCWQIAWFCPNETRLELLRVSASTYNVVLPLLYNVITVSHRATRLVNSLATNSALPKLVKILQIMAPPDVRVDPGQWAAVLPAMRNLRWLTVCSSVSFPAHVLPSITFRLITFGSFSTVVGDWAELIASQPSIEELLFISDFYAAPPSPRELPNLRVLRGRPADLARFSVQHPLEDLWFFRGPPFERRALKGRDLTLFAASPSRLLTIRISASQFLILLEAAPKLLTSLRHIVLDEEETWTDFIAFPSSRMHGTSLEIFAAAANHRFPNLRSVLLASVQHHVDPGRSRRLLVCADGPYFASIMRPLFTAPLLKTFRVLASDGAATWNDTGSDEVVYTEATSIVDMRTAVTERNKATCAFAIFMPETVPLPICVRCSTANPSFYVPNLRSDYFKSPNEQQEKKALSLAPPPRKKTALPPPEPFTPAAEEAWQATMAELPGLASQWAQGQLDDENFELPPNASNVDAEADDDDEYLDMPPLALSPDQLSGSALECLARECQRTGQMDGEMIERINWESMETRERETARKWRAWQEAELRERDLRWESALEYVVAAMREPERRQWIEDGRRQEMLAGRLPHMMRDPLEPVFAHPFEKRRRARSPLLGGDGTWQDYSATSAELEYID